MFLQACPTELSNKKLPPPTNTSRKQNTLKITWPVQENHERKQQKSKKSPQNKNKPPSKSNASVSLKCTVMIKLG